MARPTFLSGPIRYCRWASVEHPGAFWAVFMGLFSFPMAGGIFYARKLVGWEDAPRIPQSWPIPEGPRKPLNDGGRFDDPQ